MTITFDDGRQYPLVAKYDVTFADFVSGVYAPVARVPVGATLFRAFFVSTVVWNSVTSDTMAIGHQITGSAAVVNYYAAAASVAAAAPVRIPALETGLKYTVGGTVGLTWTGVGTAPTTGAGSIFIEYVLDNRAHEVQDR